MSVAVTPDRATVCDVCDGPVPPGSRADAITCSPRCRTALYRQRQREATAAYIVTDEERAAMRRAAAAVPIPRGGVLSPVVRRT